MTDKVSAGCGGTAARVADVPEVVETSVDETEKEVAQMIRIGRKAPDFTASGYRDGKFVEVKLSDFAGKWVVLCFYPGDFTFV